MCRLSYSDESGVQTRKYINDVRKELFRKSIHICALIVPAFLGFLYDFTIIALSALLILYTISEILRVKGIKFPVISQITAAAARNRDGSGFVLGPVTMALGVLTAALFFTPEAASIGICALALGDGTASLVGKIWGKLKIPFTRGKSVEGSLACFICVYASTVFISGNTMISLVVAVVAMSIEMIPLKDFDNLLIPILIAALAQYCLLPGLCF